MILTPFIVDHYLQRTSANWVPSSSGLLAAAAGFAKLSSKEYFGIYMGGVAIMILGMISAGLFTYAASLNYDDLEAQGAVGDAGDEDDVERTLRASTKPAVGEGTAAGYDVDDDAV